MLYSRTLFVCFSNWRIIALQCCVGFCHTTMQISHNFICVCVCVYVYVSVSSPSWASFPSPFPPLQVIAEHQAGLPVLCSSFPLAMCFTHDSMYMSVLLPQFVLLLALLCPQVHSLHLHLHFFPVNWYISTIFLDSIVYALIYNIYSLSDFPLNNRL